MEEKKVKKQLVKLYLVDDGNLKLMVKTADGVERFVDIFSGSGSYETIWLRTKEEIEEAMLVWKRNDKKWREEFDERQKLKQAKKWYQFWK